MRLLIAAADPTIAALIESIVSSAGVDIDTVYTEREFAECCDSDFYDVIITLFTTPFLCGSDTAHRLHHRTGHLPALFVLSWQNCEFTVMSALESGVSQFISLPVTPARLCAKIGSVLL